MVSISENDGSVYIRIKHARGEVGLAYGNLAKLVKRHNHRCPENLHGTKPGCIDAGTRITKHRLIDELGAEVPEHALMVLEENDNSVVLNLYRLPILREEPNCAIPLELVDDRQILCCGPTRVGELRPCATRDRKRRTVGLYAHKSEIVYSRSERL